MKLEFSNHLNLSELPVVAELCRIHLEALKDGRYRLLITTQEGVPVLGIAVDPASGVDYRTPGGAAFDEAGIDPTPRLRLDEAAALIINPEAFQPPYKPQEVRRGEGWAVVGATGRPAVVRAVDGDLEVAQSLDYAKRIAAALCVVNGELTWNFAALDTAKDSPPQSPQGVTAP